MILVVAYFIVDMGRYFIYPNIAALRKKNPTKTAFMEYREANLAGKGCEEKNQEARGFHYPAYLLTPLKQLLLLRTINFGPTKALILMPYGQSAMETDIKKRKLQAGGSTISQQLAKNLDPPSAKDPIRKIKEAILTWRLEKGS